MVRTHELRTSGRAATETPKLTKLLQAAYLVWWESHDLLGPPARSSTGRKIGEDLFKYPGVSGFDLLVVILVDAGIFEAVSFIERLPSRVRYLDV